MRYFFIPGRAGILSKYELECVLKREGVDKFNVIDNRQFFFLETKETPEKIKKVFDLLGGYISFGVVYEDIDTILSEISEKKVTFGISIYTDNPNKYDLKSIKDTLGSIKELLTSKGVSSRFLLPSRGLQLDSGQLLKSKMLTKGFELVILENEANSYYGKTISVQDIDLFSAIEYEKPYTNKQMGVLPAKLARMMVNIAQLPAKSTIWDPFCGSGTIPLMAFLSGYNVLGSDIDPNAIEGCEKNLAWLVANIDLSDVKYNFFQLDILKPDPLIQYKIKQSEIDGVVCEPYMGPPQFKPLAKTVAEELLKSVEDQYLALFDLLENSKKRHVTVVLVIPSYMTKKGWMTVSLNKIVSKRWEMLNLNDSGDLHWKRTNSIIRRNIFIVKGKSS